MFLSLLLPNISWDDENCAAHVRCCHILNFIIVVSLIIFFIIAFFIFLFFYYCMKNWSFQGSFIGVIKVILISTNLICVTLHSFRCVWVVCFFLIFNFISCFVHFLSLFCLSENFLPHFCEEFNIIEKCHHGVWLAFLDFWCIVIRP